MSTTPKKSFIRNLVQIQIKDFTKSKGEPAFDVEVYIKNEFNHSKSAVISTNGKSKNEAYNDSIDKAILELQNLKR